MTSSINVEDIYKELHTLLNDVCKFLNEEVENGTLSPIAKNEAEKLVSRAQKQVKVISEIPDFQESRNSNYPYLQMQRPSLVEEHLSEYVDADNVTNEYDGDYEESYAQIENGIETNVSTIIKNKSNETDCPYNDLLLNMMPEKAIKYGPLFRKERFLFIEQKKMYTVALVGYWLLLYAMNKNDMKPILTINLTKYKAEIMEQKRDPTFTIIAENEKTYEFVARSDKEIQQWIKSINFKKQMNINDRILPDIPSSIVDSAENIQHNDSSTLSNNNSLNDDIPVYESEGEVYEKIEDLKNANINPVNNIEKTPELPKRQPKYFFSKKINNVSEPPYNNVFSSTDSEGDIYDSVEFLPKEDMKQMPTKQGQDEKQEEQQEEELEIYDEPVSCKTKQQELLEKKTNNFTFNTQKHESLNYDQVDYNFSVNETEKKAEEEEEEIPDYDEVLLMPSKSPLNSFKSTSNSNHTSQTYTKAKPEILKPKPKIQSTLNKLSSFSKKKENTEITPNTPTSNKKVNMIKQQMESTLIFRNKNI